MVVLHLTSPPFYVGWLLIFVAEADPMQLKGVLQQAATVQGDIDILYTVIQEDPYVLEHVDSIPFVETLLHVAALHGHIQFVIEVSWLKPSFVVKLNLQGWRTIHVALMLVQQRVVISFIDINHNIVRVRGRGGKTPMHLATQTGSSLIGFFLNACLKSIEDQAANAGLVGGADKRKKRKGIKGGHWLSHMSLLPSLFFPLFFSGNCL
ncbi:Ankyrin repeat-containing domain [Sesbania bispinosa]|nr:Ankyrin repeat-containing domain [Sesbania bispinosa]